MNIFNVLSQGKSRLHEPSISAMLAYLLTPSEDHGLSDILLREFIELISKKIKSNDYINEVLKHEFIEANIDLEVQYSFNGKRSDVDIQVSILDKNLKELYRIVIENKIRPGAASQTQLEEYYNAIINEDDFKLENPNLLFVFLTPKSSNTSLVNEYDNLKNAIVKNGKSNHNSVWIYWSDEDEKENTLLYIIKNLIVKELNSEINPINEYMRHTLKAFIRHVDSIVSIKDEKKMRTGQDIGDIIEEAIIKTKNNKEHKIIRRDSSQIQVYNIETDEKEIARRVMAEYIDENNIDIKHFELNTRMIGRKLLDYLRNK